MASRRGRCREASFRWVRFARRGQPALGPCYADLDRTAPFLKAHRAPGKNQRNPRSRSSLLPMQRAKSGGIETGPGLPGHEEGAGMDIRDLPVHELVLDPNLNLRDRLDQETVERYSESWNRMPPVTVFEVDGRWLLADGFHRHAAAVTLGRKSIPAEVRPGSFDEALDYVAGANLHHGLPLTRAERRRAVEVKLRLHHDRSDRHLAEDLAVSRELVAKVRRQLVRSGPDPRERGPDRAPTARPIRPTSQGLPSDPNEHLPRGRVRPRTTPRPGRSRGRSGPLGRHARPVAPGRQRGAAGRRAVTHPGRTTSPMPAPSPRPRSSATAPTIEEMLSI